MRTIVRVILCGFGHVGRAFARLLEAKHADLESRYGVDLRIQAVIDIHGAAVANGIGLSLEALADLAVAGGQIETLGTYGRPGLGAIETIREVQAEMLVEATPTNLVDGEPGRSHVIAALDRGMDVVTANKGPLVLAPSELAKQARASGSRIFVSAAAAAALPTLDVGRLCTAGARIESIEGILNGTTNYILGRMDEDGCTYEEALVAAQRLGIAEADPSLDVEGKDTRSKIVLIANGLFETILTLDEVETEGITRITRADMDRARSRNQVIKLIGSARWREGVLIARVAPQALDHDHPLARVSLAEKGILLDTDTMGRITVTGGASSPTGAAAALLKDILHAHAVRPAGTMPPA